MTTDEQIFVEGARDAFDSIAILAKAIRNASSKSMADELATVIDHIASTTNCMIDVELLTKEATE